MYCSKCGSNLPEGAAVCSACGQPMVTTFAAPPAAAAPVSVPPPAYAPPTQPNWTRPAARAVAYAGFWLRFVAWIIGRIVLQFAGGILTLPLVGSIGIRELMRTHPSTPEDLFPLIAAMRKF